MNTRLLDALRNATPRRSAINAGATTDKPSFVTDLGDVKKETKFNMDPVQPDNITPPELFSG